MTRPKRSFREVLAEFRKIPLFQKMAEELKTLSLDEQTELILCWMFESEFDMERKLDVVKRLVETKVRERSKGADKR